MRDKGFNTLQVQVAVIKAYRVCVIGISRGVKSKYRMSSVRLIQHIKRPERARDEK